MRNVIEHHGIPFIAKNKMSFFFVLRVINLKPGQNVLINGSNNIPKGIRYISIFGKIRDKIIIHILMGAAR